jgi:dyslexia susceptibility 1 candidate gene 1 protein
MPIKPQFEWEQTPTDVIVTVTVKGFKKESVDVFISDLWVKVNAAPTYLLHLDLLHPIAVAQSSFYCAMPTIRITLRKPPGAEPAVWPALVIDKATPRTDRLARRQAALLHAEQLYNVKLNTRESIKAVERKRYFEEQWELEKQQRRDIEARITAERRAEQSDLEAWRTGDLAREQQEVAAARRQIFSPADVFSSVQGDSSGGDSSAARVTPPVRQNPGVVSITFSSGASGGDGGLPTRSRGDEEVYRKSRYTPVNAEDAPMVWKKRGDQAYAARRWAEAADAYSESIKRDGIFLTCTANRAACYLRLHDYKRCIADCDLALTMLSNMPASDTTQERYRRSLVRLHARRGAARAWSGDVSGGASDYRLASAYAGDDEDEAVPRDCAAIEQYMRQNGIAEQRDPLDQVRGDAVRDYYGGKHAAAAEQFRALLRENDLDMRARSNLAACLLHLGQPREALDECHAVIAQCNNVAAALQEPGAQTAVAADSDDEEGAAADDAEAAAKRRGAAARVLRDNSGHVYLLLKAYARAACACCALKNYPAAIEFFEQALRIAPYDNDLRDDANRVLEKARMAALVQSSSGAAASAQEDKTPA